jgi:hypothetical protein
MKLTTAQLVTKYNKIFHTNYCEDANCQGAWLFTATDYNGGAGTTVVDASANTNTGTFGAGGGAPTWLTSGLPKAYTAYGVSYDGGDIITCGNDASLDHGTNYSVCSWLYVDSWGTWAVCIGKRDDWNGLNWQLGSGDSSTKLRILHRRPSDSAYEYVGNFVLTTGAWFHFAWIASGTTYTFYEDGVDTELGGSASEAGSLTGDVFSLGETNDVSGSYSGDMAETAVFNDILTSTEINAIMDNGLVGAAGGWTSGGSLVGNMVI